ncbi:MAG: hypothetical protein KIT56_03495 [Gammaproteobacteria bacterium]|nr:hypothetical protein [Gammaproteobacteria bacterium]MCW5582942.1 hypothetical protein [Gammaproteobacteria bacterium]
MTFKKGDEWYGNTNGRPKGSGHRQRIFNELIMPHKNTLIEKAIQWPLMAILKC